MKRFLIGLGITFLVTGLITSQMDRVMGFALIQWLEAELEAEVALEFNSSYGLTTEFKLTNINVQGSDFSFNGTEALLAFETKSILFFNPLRILRLHITAPQYAVKVEPTTRQSKTLAMIDEELLLLDRYKITLEDFRVVNGQFSYQDADQNVRLMVASASGTRETRDHLNVEVAGHLNNRDLHFTALVDRVHDQHELSVQGDWGEFRFNTKGVAERLENLSNLDFALSIRAPSAKPLLEVLGAREVRDGALSLHLTGKEDTGNLTWSGDFSIGDLQLDALFMHSLASPDFSLEFEGGGPSLLEAGALLDYLEYDDSAFKFNGAVRRAGSTLSLEKTHLELAEGKLDAAGILPAWPGFDGWQFELNATAFNLGVLQPWSVCKIPSYAMDWAGQVQSDETGRENFTVRVQDEYRTINIDGAIGDKKDLTGTNLSFNSSGFDTAFITGCLGIDSEVNPAFTFTAGLSKKPDHWQLHELNFVTEGFSIESGMTFSDEGKLEGAAQLTASSLEKLSLVFGMTPQQLQDTPMSMAFDFSHDAGLFSVSDGSATTNSSEANFDLTHHLDLQQSSLNFSYKGDNISHIFTDTPALPEAHPFDLTAEVKTIDSEGLNFSVEGYIADNTLQLTGLLPNRNTLTGLAFELNGRGSHLEQFLGAFVEHPLPLDPYDVAFTFEHHGSSIAIDQLLIHTAGQQLQGALTLDLAPNLSGTAGQLNLTGANSHELARLFGVSTDFLNTGYELDVDFSGNKQSVLAELSSSLGESDLTGTFKLTPGAPYQLDINLNSDKIHLPTFIPTLTPTHTPTLIPKVASTTATKEAPVDRPGQVFPYIEIPWHWLSLVDVNFQHSASHIDLQPGNHAVTDLNFSIKDGQFATHDARWSSDLSSGSIKLTADSNQVHFDVLSQRIPLVWLYTGTPANENQADLNFRAAMTSGGANTLELSNNLSGRIAFRGGGGEIKSGGLDSLFGDFIFQLTKRVFSSADKSTKIECTGGALSIEAGTVKLDPGMAVRTSRFDIFAGGSIHLPNESLKLELNSRSRQGIGVSAANTFVPKVLIAGTMAQPQIQVSAKDTALSSGAAIASSGLTILASGLWNRLRSSVENPCDAVYKKAIGDSKSGFKQLVESPQ